MVDFSKFVDEKPKEEVVLDLTPEPTVQANVNPEMKTSELIKIIMLETGITNKAVTELFERKKEEMKGLVSEEAALYLIAREHGIPDKDDVPDKDVVFIMPEPELTIATEPDLKGSFNSNKKTEGKSFTKEKEATFQMDDIPEEATFTIESPKEAEIIQTDEQESEPEQGTALALTSDMKNLPSKEAIGLFIDRYDYVKKKLVKASDFQTIQGKKFLKKSGWRKFINAFGITIELVEEKVYETNFTLCTDLHAEVRVRAVAPNGQFVEGIGLKSMSKLYEKTLHNLKTTAWTRAVNRAVSDLVAFGEVSAEEINK